MFLLVVGIAAEAAELKVLSALGMQALIDFLRTSEAAAAIKVKGMEPATP